MPLGFTPISSNAVGASVRLGASAQQPGGVLGQANPAGLSMSMFMSSVSVVVRGRVLVADNAPASMRARLGALGSISSTSPKMTVFSEGFDLTTSTPSGFVGGSQVSGSFISPSEMTMLLGGAEGFAPTAYVALPQMTATLGTIGSGDPWVEIPPDYLAGLV